MNFGLRNSSNGRKRISAAAILATTALCSPSIAVAATPAPVFKAVDDHGVDLVTALPFIAIEEGGIGSGPGRISLQRIYAEGAGLVDNWTGGMFKVTAGSTVLFYVQVAGLSDTFTYAAGNGPYTNTKANGATLSREANGKYLYTSSQGTQIEFNPTGANSATACPGADAGSCAIPISIIQPNGLKFLIDWREDVSLGTDYFRLSSVLSSAGYRLAASYVTDTIGPGPAPSPDWFKRASVTFDNNANHPSPLPTVSYAYPNSTTTTVTDPANRTWTFTINASGQLTGVQRPGSASNNISFTYTSGLVTSATTDGIAYNYGRSVNGTIVTMTVTKPLSQTDVIQSDLSIGRPISFEDGNLHTTIYQYDANNRLTLIRAPEVNYVQYGYDARGNVTTVTRVAKSGSGLPNIVTSATFDATCGNIITCNKPNSTTDARGKVTDYIYDPSHGGVTSVKLPAPTAGADRPEIRLSYFQQTSAQGDLVYMLTGTSACATGTAPSCVGTANESKASAIYNSNLMATSVTRTDGLNTAALTAVNAMTYDPRGNLLTVDGPLSADTAAYKYDSADQLVGVISPDPDGTGTGNPNRAIRITYRGDGQVSKKELGTTIGQSDANFGAMTVAETVDIGFDSNSRPVTTNLSASGTNYALAQTSYDSLGRVDCVAARMNPASYSSLPASACALGTQGSFGPDRISQSVYDAANQVTQLKVSVGAADAATERTLTYTSNGLIQTLKDAENNLTTYVYDGHDRLSKTQFPTATPKGAGTSDAANYEQLTYENTQSNTRTSSTVASFRNRANETIAFGYDDLGRIISKNLPGTEPDVTYGYDGFSRLTSASQTGNALSFGWDALGHMTSEGGPHGTTSFAYDLRGKRTGVTYSTSGGGSALTVNYGWLPTGELSAITQGASTLASYTYDSLGNRTNVAFGNSAAQAMTYDPLGRLISLTNDLSGTANDLTIDNIAWNPVSQVTSVRRTGDSYAWTEGVTVGRPYASNGLNQYTASGSVTPTYDTRGNLTAAGSAAYCYSSENLLTKSGTGATCTSPSATLTYDPAMRLYQVVAGAATTRFAYDGVDAIAEYDGSSQLQRRYVFDPATGQPVVQYEGTGTASPRYLSADERGSIVSVTDGSGTLLNINRYDEYGIPQSTNLGRFGYTGQAWLPELGMQYFKARIYSPTLGRFLQTDPIGYADSPNLYAYVRGDPMNLIDPLGLGQQEIPPPNPPKCVGDICNNPSPPAPPPTGTRIPGGISPGLFGWLGTGNASQGGGAAGGIAGAFHTITTTTTYTSNFFPGFSISDTTYAVDFGAGLQFASGGPGGWLDVLRAILELRGDSCPKCNQQSAVQFPADASQLGHIFRSAPGHFSQDTPEARQMIMNAIATRYYIGTDRFGVDQFRMGLPDGRQVWAQVYKGIISNAGVNPGQ